MLTICRYVSAAGLAQGPLIVFPEQIIVPNVMRNQNIKFFGVPKIGAYAALPMK